MSEALRGVPGPGEMTTLSKLDSLCASSRQLSSSFLITVGTTAGKDVLYDCRETFPDLMQGIDWGMYATFFAEHSGHCSLPLVAASDVSYITVSKAHLR